MSMHPNPPQPYRHPADFILKEGFYRHAPDLPNVFQCYPTIELSEEACASDNRTGSTGTDDCGEGYTGALCR